MAITKGVPHLIVQITRLVDDDFPGYVECVFYDADGCEHKFLDKLPVVSAREDWPSSNDFPFPGSIACLIEEELTSESGRLLAKIDTDKPWGVESTKGITKFLVLYSQLEFV